MLRSTLALAALLTAASAAHADRAAPVDIAWIKLRVGIEEGDAAKINDSLAAPLRYEGVAFSDDACARTFGVRGTVKSAKLKRFAACLTELLGARAVSADTSVHVHGDLTTGSHPRVSHLVVQYAIEDEGDGAPDGVEGGVIGGDLGSIPPPPPPPPPRLTVPPNVVTPLMVTGSVKFERDAKTASVEPDAKAAAAIKASGTTRVAVPVKLCFTSSGAPSDVALLKSSGAASYDAAILSAFKGTRIRPYTVNGNPAPVCTEITVIYAVP